jgi:hypothetical protein
MRGGLLDSPSCTRCLCRSRKRASSPHPVTREVPASRMFRARSSSCRSHCSASRAWETDSTVIVALFTSTPYASTIRQSAGMLSPQAGRHRPEPIRLRESRGPRRLAGLSSSVATVSGAQARPRPIGLPKRENAVYDDDTDDRNSEQRHSLARQHFELTEQQSLRVRRAKTPALRFFASAAVRTL